MSNDLHNLWLTNPTGLTPKGKICPCCARYNARNIACLSLVVKDHQVLLILRKNPPMAGYWAIPGGYLDWDETTQECALRELKEETNLSGKITQLLNVYSHPEIDEDGRQNVGIFYLVKAGGTEKPNDDAARVEWFDLDKLPAKIAFNHREVIQDYMKQTR